MFLHIKHLILASMLAVFNHSSSLHVDTFAVNTPARASSLASTSSPPSCFSTSRTPRLIHQFPNGTWVENILALSTGQILVTLLNSAQVVLLDPHQQPAPTPHVIAQAHSHTAVLGIAQPDASTVAVVAGNLSYPAQVSTPGSYGVLWYNLTTAADGRPEMDLRRWFPIPAAGELDGLTTVPGSPHSLLAADPERGVIWHLDLRNGQYSPAATNVDLVGKVNGTSTAAVNGVHAQDGFVYFTNSNRASFGRIPITADGFAVATDAGEFITTDFPNTTYDDFALGDGSRFFLCDATGYSMNLAFLNGTQCVLAGGPGDVDFDHPISAMLGQTDADKDTLYVTTAGRIAGVGGIGGGQVFAVDDIDP